MLPDATSHAWAEPLTSARALLARMAIEPGRQPFKATNDGDAAIFAAQTFQAAHAGSNAMEFAPSQQATMAAAKSGAREPINLVHQQAIHGNITFLSRLAQ